MAYISFQPSDFYNTKLYTGTGSSNVLTGVGFQSDLIWTATRNEIEIHPVNDSVNGILSYLRSNANDSLETGQTQTITAQSSDGYTVGTEDRFNQSGNTFVSWNWKAGTTTGIAGSPSITPASYSFNATSGFSIIKWAGTGVVGTLPHGLGVAPKMILVKKTSAALNWLCGHEAGGWTKNWVFNEAEGLNTNTHWNNTSPTSTLFSVSADGLVNASGSDYIAYVWAEKKGYSKFGKYWGNGQSSDGTFVYTGFRPAWVMVKKITTGTGWYIWDNKREGYNGDNETLVSNTTAIGGTGTYLDLLSNGFKTLSADNTWNGSGDEYIYAAFAEFPTVSSNDIPGLAR